MANHKKHRDAVRRSETATTSEEKLEAAEELHEAELNLSRLLWNHARDCPHYLFGCEDIAHITGLSIESVYAIKRAGAPFPFNKSRPEWVTDFLRTSGGSLSIKNSRKT